MGRSRLTSPDWIPHSRPTLDERDADAVRAAVAGGYVGSGPLVREFEQQVSARVGRTFARATTTGSSALHLALLAAGVEPGDPVLIPAFVCRAVLNVVLACGANPVLVDIDPATLCITPDAVKRQLQGLTKQPVLVLVHSFGFAVDASEFQDIGVTLVEDAASSFGARSGSKAAGGNGLLSILSFASTKMMTTGQGGMVLTSDTRTAARIEALMDYDSDTRPTPGAVRAAFNYGFVEGSAALGLSQLARLDEFVKRRNEIADRYRAGIESGDALELPAKNAGRTYYRFVAMTARAEAIAADLQAHGVDARTSVAHFLHDYLPNSGRHPGAEYVRSRILSLPIYPSLSDGEIERVVSGTLGAIKTLT